MTAQFDPYHVWLGIPPAEQPPHHYRLLGVTIYEADPNVIANAADRQMAHLRSFGTSKHANLAQRLLNECAAAKVCLLRAEKKAIYDSSLRAQIAVQQPPSLAAPPIATSAFPTVAGAPRRPPKIPPRGRSKSQSGLWAAGLAALVVICGIIAAVLIANSGEQSSSPNLAATAPDKEPRIKLGPSKGNDDDTKTGGDQVTAPHTVAAKAEDDTEPHNKKSPPEEEIDATPATTGDDNANTSVATRSPTSPRFPVISLPAPDAKPFEGLNQIGGWPQGGLPREPLKLDSVEARKLRPGLILLRYPRQPAQEQELGAFVLPNQLGSPLGAPIVARGIARVHFPTNENALLIGYLRITEAGEYTIRGGNRSGRDAVYLLGEPVARYSNRLGERFSRKTLEPGIYSISLAGFADSDGHAGLNVSRRSTGSRRSSLGDAAFFHNPSLAPNPPPSPYVPGSPGQFNVQRDAISQIDLARDVVEGNWKRAGNQLHGLAEDVYARIQLPVDVPPEYDLSLRVTRESGADSLVLGVPHKGRAVGVVIDGWNENGIGLLLRDGKKSPGGIALPESSLRNGQTSQITVSVREWGVQLQIDGYVVLRSRVTPQEHYIQNDWAWSAPNLSRPFVGMRQAGFTLESLVIQPVGQPVAMSTPATVATTNPPTVNPNTTPRQGDSGTGDFATRKPVPDATKQQEVEKQVREVFAKDFAAVKKPADRATLAATLLRHAQETKDDPDATYVLLLLAKNAAADAGEATLSLRAVDQIADGYDLDPVGEKTATLTKLAGTAHQAQQVKTVFDAANELGEELVAQDKYEEAIKAFTAARNMAGKAKDSELAKATTQRIKDLAPLENQYKTVREALKKLEANADDAEANLTLGRWHWFVKHKPDKAMSFFAKSSDADLKTAAAMELENPAVTKTQLEMAGAWDEAASKRRGPEKQPLELRAFHWYLKASASAQGLEKAKADKRVEDLRTAIEKRLLADAGKVGSAPPEIKSVLSPGIVVEYFADEQLASPALTKVVENVRTNSLHRRETNLPQAGQISARWTGWLVPPKPGTYKLFVYHTAALAIDNKPVVAPRQGNRYAVLELSARPHHFRYVATNLGWGSMPQFEWQYENETSSRPIMPEFLFHVPLPGETPAELPVVRPRL